MRAVSMTGGDVRYMLAIVSVVGLTAVLAARPVLGAPQPAGSQWDGVYSADQAKRGEPLYVSHCAACHGSELAGGETAPALVGGDFSTNWNELTLGDLFERIRVSMPQNDPGAISRAQKADVLAYILFRSSYPAGEMELP